MKKFIILLLLVVLIFPCIVYAEENKINETKMLDNAVSGLLMEESTGEVIFEKEKDKQVAVASMTKMVAQIIILENIENGSIKWSDVVTVSPNAAEMGGSQIYLEAGEKMTVKDLFKGVSMASANDAVVQLAEVISGSEAKFVELMNKKVKDLGLKNTNFVNATGLDEDGHYSSAYDMAVIARELLKHEEILKFSSVYEDYLREDSEDKFWLVNTNRLVKFYDGADGLKTGHTDNAKYCIAATAKRDDMRLIAIVLGEENSKTRNAETMALLDFGFNSKKVKVLKKKGEVIDKINISHGSREYLDLVTDSDLGVLENKGISNKKYNIDTKIDNITLPIKKGEIVGKVYIKEKGKKVLEKDLFAGSNIEKLSFIDIYLDTLKNGLLGKVN